MRICKVSCIFGFERVFDLMMSAAVCKIFGREKPIGIRMTDNGGHIVAARRQSETGMKWTHKGRYIILLVNGHRNLIQSL